MLEPTLFATKSLGGFYAGLKINVDHYKIIIIYLFYNENGL